MVNRNLEFVSRIKIRRSSVGYVRRGCGLRICFPSIQVGGANFQCFTLALSVVAGRFDLQFSGGGDHFDAAEKLMRSPPASSWPLECLLSSSFSGG